MRGRGLGLPDTIEVLTAVGILDMFDVQMDGRIAAELGLSDRRAPHTFLAAAQMRGATPPQGVVVEDALAGVAVGRAGGFRCVVGVDRVGEADALLAHGADIVVKDLAELLEAP